MSNEFANKLIRIKPLEILSNKQTALSRNTRQARNQMITLSHSTNLIKLHQILCLFSTKSDRYHNFISKHNDKGDVNEDQRMHLHKSKGQHLLTNPRVLDAIVRRAEINPADTVLEIGPGTGNLTMRLLEVASRVVAVEVDSRMVEVLTKRVAEQGLQDRITIIREDALKTAFPQFDLIVANIPYNISSPLIAKFLFGANPFRSATLLLQKEFARRLLAKPGDSSFNRLAVNVQLVADVEFIMDVSKRDFVPCPKVDSSVVKIHPKDEVPDVDIDEWLAFTRTCFNKKNKTLGATFKQKKKVIELLRRSETMKDTVDIAVSHLSYNEEKLLEEEDSEEENCSPSHLENEMGLFRDKIVGVLKAGGFDEKRPSKLSNEELLYLLSLFNQAGIHFNDQTKERESQIE